MLSVSRRARYGVISHMRKTATIGLALVAVAAGCVDSTENDASALLAAAAPPRPVYDEGESVSSALTLPLCSGNQCQDCNIDVQVDNVVFVHGYASDRAAFPEFDSWIRPQNNCTQHKTYRVSLGQEAGQVITSACYPGFCNWALELTGCRANELDSACIGHCSTRSPDGYCLGYDRTKNGLCGPDGQCVTNNASQGAKKHIPTWSSDLANFFWNAKLTDLPDRSVVLVTHSTGGPVVADFMTRGYDNFENYGIPARKVKKVVTIQAALGGACGVSLAWWQDDTTSDLNDLQDDKINYDFGKATFGGTVGWVHVQSKGEIGLFGDECEGGLFTTGDTCGGTSHDGVVNNWEHSTSLKHPGGAASSAGAFPNNITVRNPEQNFCHSTGDDHPSYRQKFSRFRAVFGRTPVPVTEAMNTRHFETWWTVIW